MPSDDLAALWSGFRRAPWRFFASALPWAALVHLATTVVVAMVALTPFVVTSFLAPVWGTGLARLDRRRVTVLGVDRIVGPERPRGAGRPPLARRLVAWLQDPTTWRELGYLAVTIGIATVGFAVLVIEATTAVVGVRTVAGVGPGRADVVGRWVRTTEAAPVVVVSAAVVVLVALLYVGAVLAALHVTIARALLAPGGVQLERRVTELTYSRRALLRGFELERRRIERDLHDGAQQRLVVMSMNLGMLEVEVSSLADAGVDVRAVQRALADVRGDADRAVGALRDTGRGVFPQVLADRAHAAALHELTARSPLDVRVHVELPDRPDADVEAAAYYVVSEALTNAGRHGAATMVTVAARVVRDRFRMEVVDDGRGGAAVDRGTGLGGLRERAEVLGGTFSVSSPVGGPTTLALDLPVQLGEQD
jgi:signal transduction histidine kinase